MNLPMIMQLFQAMQGASNPMGVLMNAFGNNPMYQQTMHMVEGKNPQQLEQIARNLARERGVDIDALMRQMQIK